MKYILKAVVPGRIYDVRLGGAKIGQVRVLNDGPSAGQFLAITISGPAYRAIRMTPQSAFEELVRILNRVELCGEDDGAKAADALRRRNDEIAEHNARVREAQRPIREAFEHVLGVRLPERRDRFTKVRI